jgi:hypothetical protein
MDPRIILGGVQPDFVNVLDTSNTAAQRQNQFQQQNALTAYNQANGAAMMAGDKNALAGYAGFDPQGAMDMQTAQAQSARLSQQDQWNIEDRAKAMTKAERDAAALEVENTVKMGMMIPDAATWDAQMAQQSPDLVGQFDNRNAIAARYMSMADILKAVAPPERKDVLALEKTQLEIDALRNPTQDWRNATPAEAASQGAMAGQINTKTGKFEANNPPSSMSMTGDGEGGFTLTQGVPGGGKPPTVDQAKNAGFFIRMQDSGKILDELETQGADLKARAMALDPTGMTNYAQSPSYQKFDQARRDFVNALLRRESGAVISPDEFANADIQYFPVPGDGKEVIAQKKKNRANAIAGIEIGAGPLAEGIKDAPAPAPAQGSVLQFDAEGNLVP